MGRCVRVCVPVPVFQGESRVAPKLQGPWTQSQANALFVQNLAMLNHTALPSLHCTALCCTAMHAPCHDTPSHPATTPPATGPLPPPPQADLGIYREAGAAVATVLARLAVCERASIDEVGGWEAGRRCEVWVGGGQGGGECRDVCVCGGVEGGS